MGRPKKTEEEKAARTALTVRLPPDVLDEATAIAAEDDRSLNSYVVKAVREQNRREKGGKR